MYRRIARCLGRTPVLLRDSRMLREPSAGLGTGVAVSAAVIALTTSFVGLVFSIGDRVPHQLVDLYWLFEETGLHHEVVHGLKSVHTEGAKIGFNISG